MVCAICGAAAALAIAGLLDQRPYTSNGVGYLEIVSHSYKGRDFYVDTLSAADDNLITAGSSSVREAIPPNNYMIFPNTLAIRRICQYTENAKIDTAAIRRMSG